MSQSVNRHSNRRQPASRMTHLAALLAAGILLLLGSLAAAAQDSDLLVRVGAHHVAPKSDNHSIVEVESATMFTFAVTRFLSPHWAVELLAAAPFKHDIDLIGGGRVGSTKHLPPTLSAQYHLNRDAAFRPYVGAGLNVTLFFDEGTAGALDGSNLSLRTSVGPAAQIGADFDITQNIFANVEVRYMDIDTKARLNGESIGTVHIDPWLFGLSLGMEF